MTDMEDNPQQKIKKLHILMNSLQSIMTEMDLELLLFLIMAKVTEVMDADRSSLFLVDEKTDDLWTIVAQGIDSIRIKKGQGIVGTVAQSGETLNIPDAYEDQRFNRDSDQKTGYRTRSLITMPVNDPKGNLIGVIQVLNRNDGKPFDSEDEDLLSAFSTLAGIALSNAKAYEALQNMNETLEQRVKERTAELEQERNKADELLRNILPSETATELKVRGSASPRQYDTATVMFTDFKGFTELAEKMNPGELLKELDHCFHYFDEVVERYSLEKIKTMGDAYMCAGGLPTPNGSNPVDTVLAALDMLTFIKELEKIKIKLKMPFWQIRIGVHTGPLIAGVVGKKKFAYDIWGDTVNTASRMESSGTIDKINISSSTYELIKDFFECTYRGKVEAKGKGEIDMYYVDRILPEFSADSNGQKPNEAFMQKVKETFV